MENNKTYSVGKFAKMLNVTVHTLQNWDYTGKLTAYRTPTNRRFYTHQQYLDYMGISEAKPETKTVIYARVSSRNQKDDLKSQIDFLKTYANASGIIVDEIISDIGSGLNYNREGFNNILYRNDIKRIIISYKDRFIRFGYDWFETFLKRKGVEILIVNNEDTSPEQEMITDLISIIHVFSCRMYGLRKYKTQIKNELKKALTDGKETDTETSDPSAVNVSKSD